ncbi:MAG: M6 family metalloprotease domain-containing protein [Candidatus Krumholzibacteria bacterium]|nr:M6 family metalloprotease domain-containing protein [Candidatus Krumholzibacteria bacterium]
MFLATTASAVAPPRDGGALPESMRRASKLDASAYTVKHAWAQKARRMREQRRDFVVHNGPGALAAAAAGDFALTGTMRVPVLPGYFSDQAVVPITAANLQLQLFDSNPTGTIGQYYSEVSYGQFTIDGDVFTWTKLANVNSYYAGSSNGTVPGFARTGEFIKELLDARDGSVDFGQYDNDGPDGVPNSGDDDGFVDLLCVMHSLPGAECGTYPNNISSHTWSYSAWPASGDAAFVTNDPAAGGGFILVDDYTIGPALNCSPGPPDGTGKYPQPAWIDIGVYCHEFGHGLGLPDLYDRNGGSNGIGHWGIMGAGSWNTPERPAHPEAWTRVELGWTVPVDIGWQPVTASIGNAEQNPVAYRLPFTDDLFRRSSECVIAGNYSLYCGRTAAEAAARNYADPGAGYGPNWVETIERDFTYGGTGTVTFSYKYRYDVEPGYDFGYALIEVNGVEDTLATYTGPGNGTATIALAPHLAPLAGAGGTYTLKFRATSDYSFDDADGNDPSTCGLLAIDDVSVQGGGENYTSGFETYADGWFQDPAENPVREYWLVENRQRIGGDLNLEGEGMLVWHVDEGILHSPTMQNDGTGGAVRGLVLEEADGLVNMVGSNFGDEGDPFPGTASNTLFGSLTNPSSIDNTQRATRIEVSAIGASAPTMSATLRAGNRGPLATAVAPPAIDNDQVAAQIEIAGARIQAGATFVFVLPGAVMEPSGAYDSGDILPVSLEWVDATLIRATVNVYSKTAGLWDLVVTNPDGQSYTLASAVTINHIVATMLRDASISVTDTGVRLRYELLGREANEVVRLYRSQDPDGGWRVIADGLEPQSGGSYEFVDTNVEPGRTYYYLLESQIDGDTPRELHRGSATVPARDMVLEQNHPNPFNPSTSIRFFLPARGTVALNVYDIRGALVRRLAQGTFDAGAHTMAWDGTDDAGRPVASGVYVYRLTADRRSQTRKMLLVK